MVLGFVMCINNGNVGVFKIFCVIVECVGVVGVDIVVFVLVWFIVGGWLGGLVDIEEFFDELVYYGVWGLLLLIEGISVGSRVV